MCGWERREGATLALHVLVSSSSVLVHAFSQGMVISSQSEANEIDFNQNEAKSTDLGILDLLHYLINF